MSCLKVEAFASSGFAQAILISASDLPNHGEEEKEEEKKRRRRKLE